MIRATILTLRLRLHSVAAYKLNLTVSFLSAVVGALSYFANASFRDVVISTYGVSYTSYAVAGAVAAALTVVNPIYLTPYDLTILGAEARVTGEVLLSLLLGAAKAMPILLLGLPYLRPSPYIAVTLPFLLLMEVSISTLLTASELLLAYENIVSWVYYGLWNLMSGLWFPIEALPHPLDRLAFLLPQYHLISLARDPLIGIFPLQSIVYSALFSLASYSISRYLLSIALSKGSLVVRHT